MPKTYEKIEILTGTDDIEIIYQGKSYITDYDETKVTVELSIDEVNEEEITAYIIEVESVDLEILINEEDVKLYLKQYLHYYTTKWKFKTTGLSVPEVSMPNLGLGVIINIDEKVIDVIFGRWS